MSEMEESLKNILGRRKPTNHSDLKKTRTSGSESASDNTDFIANQTSENNATQKSTLNKPVEQDEEKSKEEQKSNTQTDSRSRDPPHNIGKPVHRSSNKKVFEERRSSFPLDLPGNKEWGNIQHHHSEPLLSQVKKGGERKLDDPLYESVRSNLVLLEGLARCLDKHHPYGRQKCWKHVAEYFGVEAGTYEAFTCRPENSPTENLFYFLKTRFPDEFTIEKLKDGLNYIERNDVIHDVLMKYQGSDSALTDETSVGSLFDSHPLIIGEIALLLDVNTRGKKNWKQLADKLDVPKSESQNFGEAIQGDPTGVLLEYIKCTYPEMTVGYLQGILEDLQMQEASDVLTNSTTLAESTLLKNIWDADYEAAENLCNHLNQMYNSRTRGWRVLGYKLKIEKEVLDTFSPHEDEVVSPTEALINYLGGAQVTLTMADLILALASIGRKDALSVVKVYFPEGCVENYLECKRSSPAETAV